MQIGLKCYCFLVKNKEDLLSMHYNLLKENWELEKVKDIDLRSCKNWVEASAGKNRNPKSRFRDKSSQTKCSICKKCYSNQYLTILNWETFALSNVIEMMENASLWIYSKSWLTDITLCHFKLEKGKTRRRTPFPYSSIE